MAPRGRPASTRGVYAMEDATLLLPDEFVVDTSFIVDALIATQPRHNACRTFLEQMAEAGTVIYFNRLLELELAETAFKIALKESHGGRWRTVRHDGRSRNRGRHLLDRVRGAWDEVRRAIPSACVEVGEVVEQVPDFMSRFGLSSYDAVHAATARYVNVRDLVTLDFGFTSIPSRALTLHVDRSRLTRFRNARTS